MKTLTRSWRAFSRNCCVPCQSMSNSTSRPARSAFSTGRAACRSDCPNTLAHSSSSAGFHHRLEAGQIDEMIIASVDLARPLRARRHRHRQLDVDGRLCSNMRDSVVLPAPEGEDRTSIRPRRATALRFRRARFMPYSTFCTCSRNCSTAAFSSSPILVSSTSLALAHSVLASRLSSCAKKSSRRPTARRRR